MFIISHIIKFAYQATMILRLSLYRNENSYFTRSYGQFLTQTPSNKYILSLYYHSESH
jgi:hypothetical protein